MTKALGVDPDIYNVGLAVVEQTMNGQRLRRAGVSKLTRTAGVNGRSAVIKQISQLAEQISQFCGRDSISKIAVEGQQIYIGKSNARPDDILKIALVAGGCIAACRLVFPRAEIYCPRPVLWKGSVPKGIHQARVCKRFNIKFKATAIDKPVKDIEAPQLMRVFNKISKAQWSHVIDAAGLGGWALSKGIL